MSTTEGQITRHGITIQSHRRSQFSRPGWLNTYMNDVGTARPAWMSGAISRGGQNRPIWASQLVGGDEIFIHDLHRGYSRYPGRIGTHLNLNLDTNLEGKYHHFTVDCSVSGVARYSHWGLNRGARKGNLTVRVRAWSNSNALILDWGSVSTNWENGVFGGDAISGWTPYWNPWSRHFNLGQPIRRVLVNTRLITGNEQFHDVGDRSNGSGWNPWHVIGAHHQYNYFDIIGINEGSSTQTLEMERRVDVKNGAENTLSWRKGFI